MKVSGVLKDQYGLVDGATIILLRNGKRTNVATISNPEGYFELENREIQNNDDFEIRFLGNKTLIKKASEINSADEIMMQEDTESLDEVVITNVGEKPVDNQPILVRESKISPILVFSILGVVTLATIILIIRKSR
jgi:hypothetical protein